MKKLKIKEINNYDYLLEDEAGKEYKLNLEFFDVDGEIKVGDYINISDELLDENYQEYSTMYCFGSLDDVSGRPNLVEGDIDVIKIETEGKEIILKRLYG